MSRYALVKTVYGYLKESIQSCEESALLEAINDIRQELYSWYEDTSLFVDIEECFELQDFCRDCNGVSSFRGVTLPPEYAAPEAMWFGSTPIPLRTRWRAWQEGIPSPCDCGLRSHDMGDAFPTERDLLPGRPDFLGVSALNPDDFGKKIRVRGFYAQGQPFEHEFTLSHEWQWTPSRVATISLNGVSKDVTAGRVLLAAKGDECQGRPRRLLSDYAPFEEVPAYKRLQIQGVPSGCDQIFIRAARHFRELYHEDEVVETGNRRVWQDMGRWLRIHTKTDRTRDDIASETAYRNHAKALLLGDKARTTGKSPVSGLRLSTPRIGLHSLSRVRRGLFRR